MEHIVIENLVKKYKGLIALNDVSLTIGQGMFGLLGRNGAGKTTLLRILATTLQRTSGTVNICGMSLDDSQAIRKIIGYLPQSFNIYPNFTVYEVLDYFGLLSEMKKDVRKRAIKNALNKTNLSTVKKVKIGALSGGMLRRLGIAQAILANPKVLIVDEPTTGLDPEERYRLRDLLEEMAEERIVILSTHIVEDIEKACSSLAILNEGRIAYKGSVSGFVAGKSNLEEAYINLLGEVE